MKTITDIIFPKKFKAEAEEYIAYKRSLGFKFPWMTSESCYTC